MFHEKKEKSECGTVEQNDETLTAQLTQSTLIFYLICNLSFWEINSEIEHNKTALLDF